MRLVEKLNKRMDDVNSLVCVGLDADKDKLPKRFLHLDNPQFEFNKVIIEQTHEYVCAYKPNLAFYEAGGEKGMGELQLTMDYLRQEHSEIFTICDAKRADIGNTNTGYVKAYLDDMGFDAITVNPFLGREALEPFLEREDKVSVVMCRTSNSGSGEFQDLEVEGKKLWQVVAEKVRDEWNGRGNCMLVVGATYPEELAKVRQIVGEMTLLVPGVGAQGGQVEATVRAGINRQAKGIIINSSRAIIFDENPNQAVKSLRDEINKFR